MVYPRYSQMFPTVAQRRDAFQRRMIESQRAADAELFALAKTQPQAVESKVNELAAQWSGEMMSEWKSLGEYLIMKFNDQVVKKETPDGKWELTPDGICVDPERPGFPEDYRKVLIRETGDKYRVPQTK